MKNPFGSMVTRLVVLAAAVVAFSGCLPSVHGLYTEKDLVGHDELVGLWVEKGKEDGQFWKIEKEGEKNYRLLITEEGRRGNFSLHVVKLKDKEFFDLQADPDTLEGGRYPDLYKAAIIPGHIFFKVKLDGKQVKLAYFGGKAIDDELKSHPEVIAHARSESGVVLTASTAELQKFVLKMYDKPEAFGEEGTLEKVKSK